VNVAIANRLRAAGTSDLPANAVILLDLYAMDFPHRFESVLEEIRHLFTPFLELDSPEP
jgi:ABC-type antimicrobial peptide transport system permease subunit